MARVTLIRRRVADGPCGFSAYARLLEEAATTASAQAGYPPQWYAEQATAWVIRRSTIECPKPLETGCELEISTWVADFRRVRSRREYVARAAGTDAVVLSAHTDWVYVDRAAGRPARIPGEMMRAFVPAGAIATLPRPALELPQAPADARTMTHDVHPADVDALDHVNNAKYFDYVEQSALAVVGAGFRPCRHDLEYVAEARRGDRLVCRSWRHAGAGAELEVATEIHRVRDGTRLTRSRSIWTSRPD